jgi:hypothetical protein
VATLIGTTTAGGANDFFAAGEAAYSNHVAAAGGDIGAMSALIRASAFTSLILGIYSNTGTLLGQTAAITSTTAGVKTANMVAPVTIVSGTTYRLAWLPLGGSVDFTNTSSGSGWHMRTGQVAFPNPWGVSDVDSGVGLPIQGDSTFTADSTMKGGSAGMYGDDFLVEAWF